MSASPHNGAKADISKPPLRASFGHLGGSTMLADIWSFLHPDENLRTPGRNRSATSRNRAVLTWIGSGVVVVAGAVWADNRQL
jgi:hypothetical protein